MRRMRDTAERFWSHVDTSGDCWLWTGSLNGFGYARFSVTIAPRRRINYGAHVWAWEQEHGPVPAGLELDHLCRNRRCVNPAHLEAVSHQENVLRGVTLAASNLLKTHCPQGHPYSPENTYVLHHGNGTQRQCKTCSNARATAYMKAKRAKQPGA
jgi:hypothetical protein